MSVGTELTPNPNALKFVLSSAVKNEGNSTYRSPSECETNPLALALFKVRGVDQIHIFDNVITVSKFNYQDWIDVEEQLITIIKNLMPSHDANYYDPDPEAERRRDLSEEQKEIELILDKTIRPGLQADGGDIQTISYQENVLIIRYQGACGSCPSSTTGTLEAIKAILRDEYNPKIDVYIEPTLY
ncbi:MAG: NifU family protein [Bacteriovoracaceae bacterium]|nr:NifU family protein [Bacteriovoracaceae bacterium]